VRINRREAIGLGLAGTGAATLPGMALARTGVGPAIVQAHVCGLDTPLALGDLTPRFSWTLAGQVGAQSAWRIRVARNAPDLAAARNLLWDSGRVASTQCFDIAYGGPALPSRTQAFWQVEAWTVPGHAPLRSGVMRWETGLDPADWHADWLASETQTASIDRHAGLHWITGTDSQKAGQARAFRWTIDLPKAGPVELCLSGHETTGVWINGTPAPPPRDGPARWTEMAVRPLNLPAGRTVVAVAVNRRVGFGVAPCMLTALLRHGDGFAQRLTSADAGWKVALDAPPGWQAADFADASWADAVAATGNLPIGQPWPITPASRLRRRFVAPRAVRSARLHATALGVYDAMINGVPVDDRRLAPEFTDPSQRILYQTYDVTHLIRRGANMIGFVVGDGWYGSRFSTSGRFAFGAAPCRLRAQLELEFDDGTTAMIGTGADWQIADSEILAHSIYDGEIHDARLEQPGWALPGASDAGWRTAVTVGAPAIAVEPQRCPPIRVRQTLAAQTVHRIGPGHFVVDFGQNFAGVARLSVEAAAGTRIELRFSELLHDDGTVDQANLRTARARDIYIAAGRGRETWVPRFTYHGFRYVEITGVPDDQTAWHVEGLMTTQDLAMTGELRCGDPVIAKFWRNSVWSQQANFQGLPTDCPQRDERLGWMGDAEVFWPAAAWNMDVAAYTARVMEDVRHGQSAKGAFPDCIPPFVPTLKLSSPGWADAGIVLPHTAWMQYGDTGVIHANWAAMEAYMHWIAAANPDHLWQKNHGADYGDWLSVDAPTSNPGAPTTPKALVATAFWAEDARMMAAMATAIGDQPAAARYRDLFAAIADAFRRAYVGADGAVGNGSQTGYVLAIRFGLLSGDHRQQAGQALAADITRRGNHLSTGFLGTPHILDALAMSGQEAMAITLLLQRSAPSWGYMVGHGATSMWERWDSDTSDPGMNSRNHYAFGAIGAFLFRRVAGIEPVAPGFAGLRIAPIMDPRLGSGGATYRSMRGTIRTDWTARDGRFRLDVELPDGVSADVALPRGMATRAQPGPNRYSGAL